MSTQATSPKDVFPFFELPGELRESIYLYAVQPLPPVDTAAIPGTPDRVIIPKVAQLCTQMREEALHIFFKNRPVEISLHSEENVRRALLWADKWEGHTIYLAQVVFSGRLSMVQNEFFYITLDCSEEVPFFRACARPGASRGADTATDNIKHLLTQWFQRRCHANPGVESRLSGGELVKLIHLVERQSRHGR